MRQERSWNYQEPLHVVITVLQFIAGLQKCVLGSQNVEFGEEGESAPDPQVSSVVHFYN